MALEVEDPDDNEGCKITKGQRVKKYKHLLAFCGTNGGDPDQMLQKGLSRVSIVCLQNLVLKFE